MEEKTGKAKGAMSKLGETLSMCVFPGLLMSVIASLICALAAEIFAHAQLNSNEHTWEVSVLGWNTFLSWWIRSLLGIWGLFACVVIGQGLVLFWKFGPVWFERVKIKLAYRFGLYQKTSSVERKTARQLRRNRGTLVRLNCRLMVYQDDNLPNAGLMRQQVKREIQETEQEIRRLEALHADLVRIRSEWVESCFASDPLLDEANVEQRRSQELEDEGRHLIAARPEAYGDTDTLRLGQTPK